MLSVLKSDLPNVVAKVLMNHDPAMIGGSYVVNPEQANDIDIIVHEFLHHPEWLNNLGFVALQKGDKDYDEIDHVRLINVYERYAVDEKKVNVIVVGAAFWPAYVGAIQWMKYYPHLYQTREQRIELHRGKCREVARIAGIALPDSAY